MKNEIHFDQSSDKHRPCWMLVDDSKEVLNMMNFFLAHMTDATIECYDSPTTALEAFAAAPEKYELVMTDYEMPDLMGTELLHHLHHIAPNVKVCLMTGSGHFTQPEARREGFDALLNKPFLPKELQGTLMEVLESNSKPSDLMAV